MKFKTQWNGPHETVGEKNSEPSLTIPDQTMSVKTILDNYSRGIPMTVGQVPVYNGEDIELPDFKKMDLSEIQELSKIAAENVAYHKQKLQEQEYLKNQAEKEEAIEAEIQRRAKLRQRNVITDIEAVDDQPPGTKGATSKND